MRIQNLLDINPWHAEFIWTSTHVFIFFHFSILFWLPVYPQVRICIQDASSFQSLWWIYRGAAMITISSNLKSDGMQLITTFSQIFFLYVVLCSWCFHTWPITSVLFLIYKIFGWISILIVSKCIVNTTYDITFTSPLPNYCRNMAFAIFLIFFFFLRNG